MKAFIQVCLAAFSVGAAALWKTVGGGDALAVALVVAMAIDYVTGILCAAIWHKSPKSPSGALESRAGLKGLFRKAGIILCVILATELSGLLDTFAIRDSTIIFFVCNEALSIIENLAIMGVPFPPAIKAALDTLQQKADPTGESDKKNTDE